MKSKLKLSLGFVIVLLTLAALVACSGTTTSTATVTSTVTTTQTASTQVSTTTSATVTPQTGGTFTRITMRDITSPWGWPSKVMVRDREQLYPCVDTLVREDSNIKIQPWLAESWEIANDRSSITFKLTKGVKFQDGTDFNAEAAKYNLDAVLEAKVPGTECWNSVNIVDDYSVRINLNKWMNNILSSLSGAPGLMVSPTSVEQHGVEWAEQNPVGTGAFKFVGRVQDTSIEWERFDGYWQKDKPYLDKIKYIVMADMMTQTATLKSGEGNELNTFFISQIVDLKDWGADVIYQHDGALSLWPDAMNADSPFSNKLVRQALSYAINRNEITQATGFGIYEPAYQFGIPTSLAYIPGLTQNYDLTKARQLLKDAGYAEGFDCTLYALAPFKDQAVSVQNYWAEIGVKATVEVMTDSDSTMYQTQGWHNGCLVMAGACYTDGLKGLDEMFLNPSYMVSVGLSDEGKSLYNEARATTYVEKEKVQTVYQNLFDDTRVIPLMYIGVAHVLNPDVTINDHGFNSFSEYIGWTPESIWVEVKK